MQDTVPWGRFYRFRVACVKGVCRRRALNAERTQDGKRI
nr:MAG TPA: hypothetical protein [Caudoviricetes sp.]